MSLATKYRPKTIEDVIGQDLTKQILSKQIERKQFSNCYLFAGPSGTGKTTLGRILASHINNNQGKPKEIDAASNNGVDNVREIVEDAKERSLDGTYKIYIIDECHLITSQGWGAFLKCIEETPKYTIFIFCTTDPKKLPEAIKNRCMRFNLTRVSSSLIESRLNYIVKQENISITNEAISYIAKISSGSVREAISNLEYITQLDTNLDLVNTMQLLGHYSYSDMFKLVNNIIDKQEKDILEEIDSLYLEGVDLTKFVSEFVSFVLELDKYCCFRDINLTNLPPELLEDVKYACGVCETPEQSIKYYNSLLDKLLDIQFKLKGESNIKSLLQSLLLQLARG